MTVPNDVSQFVLQFAKNQKAYWNNMQKLGPGRRGKRSAVMDYYERIGAMCDGALADIGTAPPIILSAKGGDVVAFVSEVEKKLKAQASGRSARSSAASSPAGTSDAMDAAVNNVAARPEFASIDEVQALAARITESRNPTDAFEVAQTSVMESLVDKLIVGPRRTSRASARTLIDPGIWSGIAGGIKQYFKAREGVFPCTTLIYCYWLDEAGVQWAVERAAFRAENGDEAVTGRWPVFNLSRDADLVGVLAGYTTAWQRGDLAALQERQQMYFALYGYPLYIAARGRPMRTPDPRHVFPGAFNNFLSAAMKYYEQERNLNFDPNVAATRAAFDQLATSLKEGDQNMRDFRPPEMRAQFEYLKDVLGDENSEELNSSWQQVLQSRPGLQEASERWTTNCDSIAEANRWRRPHARNYRTLAENGEVILVVSRAFDAMFGGSVDPVQMEAFIQMMRGPIQSYVEAFNAVCGVDLEREPTAKPPAALMAKRYPPPQDAPWPRYWEPGNAVSA